MSSVVYTLCAAASLFCAVLVTRSYRAGRDRVLLWSPSASGAWP